MEKLFPVKHLIRIFARKKKLLTLGGRVYVVVCIIRKSSPFECANYTQSCVVIDWYGYVRLRVHFWIHTLFVWYRIFKSILSSYCNCGKTVENYSKNSCINCVTTFKNRKMFVNCGWISLRMFIIIESKDWYCNYLCSYICFCSSWNIFRPLWENCYHSSINKRILLRIIL